MNAEIDIREVLPTISVPTLVLHRAEETGATGLGSWASTSRVRASSSCRETTTSHGRATRRRCSTRSSASWPVSGRRWSRTGCSPHCCSPTSSDRPRRRRSSATAAGRPPRQHHRLVRAQVARFRGREVDTAGDGVFATFDGPARAVRCASAIVATGSRPRPRRRAGVHTGEVEQADGQRTRHRSPHRRAHRRGGPRRGGARLRHRQGHRRRLGHRLRGARRAAAAACRAAGDCSRPLCDPRRTCR